MSLGFRGRRVLALLFAIVTLAFAIPRFLTHTPYPRLGIVPTWKTASGIPEVDQIYGPPGRGVLEKGDRLLMIEGEPFTRDVLRKNARSPAWRDRTITVEIERGGNRLSIELPPVRLNAWQRVRLFTLQLVAVVAAPLVAFLLLWRRPDLMAAWAFMWFAALQGLSAVWSLFRFPQGEFGPGFRFYLDFYHGMILWFPASFLHFMTVFPRPRWPQAKPWTSVWFWAVAAAYLAPAFVLIAGHGDAMRTDRLYLYFQTIVLPLGALALIARYSLPGGDDWRPQARERVIAVSVAVVLLLAAAIELVAEDPRVMAMFEVPVIRMLYFWLSLAWLCSPLFIAFLIANDPVFDPRRILVRSLPYALLTGVLGAIYLGVVVIAERLFAEFTGEEAMLFNVVAALIVAFAFAPLRDRLQLALDRLYGRDPRATRAALDRAGHDLLSALDGDEVKISVRSALTTALRRPVGVDWQENGPPRLAPGEELAEDVQPAVENLLSQAGTRLENLALAESRAAAERRAVELREAATRAELRALQAQVQPHFLFNALNALSYLTETDPPAAQRFTERLADMLRYTVEAGARPAALLSEELAFVEDYLGVARERYETPLEFKAGVAPELLSTAVPPLLLQPLVENSLKHGCGPDSQGLHLSLEACREQGWFTLRFADDGAASGNGAPRLGGVHPNPAQHVL